MALSQPQLQKIKDATSDLRQGDLISTTHFPVLETPEYTFDEDVEGIAAIPGQDVWAIPVRPINTGWGVIITQTCDVVRAIDREPFLQIVPLIALANDNAWHHALHGRSASFFALPTHNHDDVCSHPAINAQVSFAASKAALLHPKVRTLATPLDPASRIRLSMWLARRSGRHPFPDSTEEHILRPLRTNLVKRAKNTTTQPGAFVDSLLGIWCTPDDAAVIEVYFVMSGQALAAHSKQLPDAETIDAQAQLILRPIRERLTSNGIGYELEHKVRTLDGVSAQELLLEHRQIDMDLRPLDDFIARHVIATSGEAADPA